MRTHVHERHLHRCNRHILVMSPKPKAVQSVAERELSADVFKALVDPYDGLLTAAFNSLSKPRIRRS
jgi:hypothetical protein